jgi:hypothetical protein
MCKYIGDTENSWSLLNAQARGRGVSFWFRKPVTLTTFCRDFSPILQDDVSIILKIGYIRLIFNSSSELYSHFRPISCSFKSLAKYGLTELLTHSQARFANNKILRLTHSRKEHIHVHRLKVHLSTLLPTVRTMIRMFCLKILPLYTLNVECKGCSKDPNCET